MKKLLHPVYLLVAAVVVLACIVVIVLFTDISSGWSFFIGFLLGVILG